MPRIKPTSVQDLLRFIEDHRSDIENGMYDIQIQDEWVPHIPETSVRFLVKHCTSSHGSFSRHPKSHLDVLSILARDKSESVRSLVARNPSTPIEVLALLSRDKGEEVRNSVAINPRATPDVLSILAKDTGIIKIQGTKYEIVPIRAAVARHPNTPPEILEILAVDADYSVRCAVAANPHTPVQQLLNLAGDVHETGISSNPRISEVLGNLAKDDWANRQWVAACSPYSPISMLKSFAKDHKYSVRIRVVRNPNTPSHVVRALRWDKNKDVREAAGATCFIATAVYGSEFEPEVELLRNYRDRVLANYKLGRLFIATYYAISPPVAHFIKSKRWTRNSVRCFILDPIVRIIRIS